MAPTATKRATSKCNNRTVKMSTRSSRLKKAQVAASRNEKVDKGYARNTMPTSLVLELSSVGKCLRSKKAQAAVRDKAKMAKIYFANKRKTAAVASNETKSHAANKNKRTSSVLKSSSAAKSLGSKKVQAKLNKGAKIAKSRTASDNNLTSVRKVSNAEKCLSSGKGQATAINKGKMAKSHVANKRKRTLSSKLAKHNTANNSKSTSSIPISAGMSLRSRKGKATASNKTKMQKKQFNNKRKTASASKNSAKVVAIRNVKINTAPKTSKPSSTKRAQLMLMNSNKSKSLRSSKEKSLPVKESKGSTRNKAKITNCDFGSQIKTIPSPEKSLPAKRASVITRKKAIKDQRYVNKPSFSSKSRAKKTTVNKKKPMISKIYCPDPKMLSKPSFAKEVKTALKKTVKIESSVRLHRVGKLKKSSLLALKISAATKIIKRYQKKLTLHRRSPLKKEEPESSKSATAVQVRERAAYGETCHNLSSPAFCVVGEKPLNLEQEIVEEFEGNPGAENLEGVDYDPDTSAAVMDEKNEPGCSDARKQERLEHHELTVVGAEDDLGNSDADTVEETHVTPETKIAECTTNWKMDEECDDDEIQEIIVDDTNQQIYEKLGAQKRKINEEHDDDEIQEIFVKAANRHSSSQERPFALKRKKDESDDEIQEIIVDLTNSDEEKHCSRFKSISSHSKRTGLDNLWKDGNHMTTTLNDQEFNLRDFESFCKSGLLNRAADSLRNIPNIYNHFSKGNIITTFVHAAVLHNQLDKLKCVGVFLEQYYFGSNSFLSNIIVLCEGHIVQETQNFFLDIIRYCEFRHILLSLTAVDVIHSAFLTDHHASWKLLVILHYTVVTCQYSPPMKLLNQVLDSVPRKSSTAQQTFRILCKLPEDVWSNLDQDILVKFLDAFHSDPKYSVMVTFMEKGMTTFRMNAMVTSPNPEKLVESAINGARWSEVAIPFRKYGLEHNSMVFIMAVHEALLKQGIHSGECYSQFAFAVTDNKHLDLESHLYQLLGNIGTALLLENHYKKQFMAAYECLQTMHKYNLDYCRLQKLAVANSGAFPLHTMITPCRTVLVAIDTCLEVEAFPSAFIILESFYWVKPSNQLLKNVKYQMNNEEILWRARLLKTLAENLLKEDLLDKGILVLKHLFATISEDLTDRNVKVTPQMLDVDSLYRNYMIAIIRKRHINDALEILHYYKKMDVMLYLSDNVLRSLLILCISSGKELEVKKMFFWFCRMGLYSVSKPSSESHCLQLKSNLRLEEIILHLLVFLKELYKLIHVQKKVKYKDRFALSIKINASSVNDEEDLDLLNSISALTGDCLQRVMFVLQKCITPPLEVLGKPTFKLITVCHNSLYKYFVHNKKAYLPLVTEPTSSQSNAKNKSSPSAAKKQGMNIRDKRNLKKETTANMGTLGALVSKFSNRLPRPEDGLQQKDSTPQPKLLTDTELQSICLPLEFPEMERQASTLLKFSNSLIHLMTAKKQIESIRDHSVRRTILPPEVKGKDQPPERKISKASPESVFLKDSSYLSQSTTSKLATVSLTTPCSKVTPGMKGKDKRLKQETSRASSANNKEDVLLGFRKLSAQSQISMTTCLAKTDTLPSPEKKKGVLLYDQSTQQASKDSENIFSSKFSNSAILNETRECNRDATRHLALSISNLPSKNVSGKNQPSNESLSQVSNVKSQAALLAELNSCLTRLKTALPQTVKPSVSETNRTQPPIKKRKDTETHPQENASELAKFQSQPSLLTEFNSCLSRLKTALPQKEIPSGFRSQLPPVKKIDMQAQSKPRPKFILAESHLRFPATSQATVSQKTCSTFTGGSAAHHSSRAVSTTNSESRLGVGVQGQRPDIKYQQQPKRKDPPFEQKISIIPKAESQADLLSKFSSCLYQLKTVLPQTRTTEPLSGPPSKEMKVMPSTEMLKNTYKESQAERLSKFNNCMIQLNTAVLPQQRTVYSQRLQLSFQPSVTPVQKPLTIASVSKDPRTKTFLSVSSSCGPSTSSFKTNLCNSVDK